MTKAVRILLVKNIDNDAGDGADDDDGEVADDDADLFSNGWESWTNCVSNLQQI